MAVTAKRKRSLAPHRSKVGATIRDVAKRAGVSVATVSRTLNGVGPVRAITSRHVLKIAQAMRYVPHAAARSLSSRRSHTLGVLLPELHGEFFSEVIRGIDVAARQRGYHILVSGSHSDTDEMIAVLAAMRGRVDGLLIMSPDLDLGPLSRNIPPAMPVVLLNSTTRSHRAIQIDNYSGAREMTRYILSLGHTWLAFIAGPERNIDAAERTRGFRDAMRGTAGRPMELEGEFTEESGYRTTSELLSRVPRPTAIFAANDAMAIGALHALREKKLRVPEDVSLAGFDDIPLARFLTPPLTTVRVDIAELGRRAVDMLLAQMEGSSASAHKDVIPTTLIVRDSCGVKSASQLDRRMK
ncbi:MAG TPA: LacI family DNA-binding transcriptional regulator [Thermoanaerobaculia bacterium]|nr:LacI family DNA-binding transcriptional regulator [Thermoanaerobaculia bacterium]